VTDLHPEAVIDCFGVNSLAAADDPGDTMLCEATLLVTPEVVVDACDLSGAIRDIAVVTSLQVEIVFATDEHIAVDCPPVDP
jgi:hypothetical protein